jgi:hypothetical protein
MFSRLQHGAHSLTDAQTVPEPSRRLSCSLLTLAYFTVISSFAAVSYLTLQYGANFIDSITL